MITNKLNELARKKKQNPSHDNVTTAKNEAFVPSLVLEKEANTLGRMLQYFLLVSLKIKLGC